MFIVKQITPAEVFYEMSNYPKLTHIELLPINKTNIIDRFSMRLLFYHRVIDFHLVKV